MNSTPKHIVAVITYALVFIVLSGMLGVYLLIVGKSDPALIAVLSGHTGTALGGLMSMLNNTRSGSPDEPVPTRVVNPPSDPVETHES
jgi:hypothetical protein